MKPTRSSLSCRRWFRVAVLFLCFPAGVEAVAQTPLPQDEYYETCRRLGFLPGTTPMRRCILAQRSIDLDPLNALSDYQLTQPGSAETPAPESGLDGEFPGARDAEQLLKDTPEGLLLGPDYRARGQGIYE